MKRTRYNQIYRRPLLLRRSRRPHAGPLDFLLDSGFNDPMSRFQSLDGDQTMENLREAIRQALDSGELFDEETQEKYESLEEEQVEELIDQIIQKMQEQNMINAEQPQEGQGDQGDGNGQSRFEVTDKGMDFLGTKRCASFRTSGQIVSRRHDTRHEASGVETNGSSKPYEFGDSLNLDITTTLSNVFAREGTDFNKHGGKLNLEYSDLQVQQADYQSSCATVVLLDCSHSMILIRRRPLYAGQACGHGARPPDPDAVSRRHHRSCSLP